MITTNTSGISGQLSRGTLLIFLALVGVVIGSLWWATDRGDRWSIDRQEWAARHAIDMALDDLALQQETVAIWDEAAKRLTAPRPDAGWGRRNITGWLSRIFNHDEGFIVDGRDRPVEAAVKGRSVPNGRFDHLRADLAPMIDSVRGRISGPNGRHDRNPGRPLAANSSVRTTDRTTHDTQLMLIDGRPAAASAMLVKPSRASVVPESGAGWPMVVSIRYLDADFLAELDDRGQVTRPRYSRTDNPGRDEHSIPLRSEAGRPLGYLIWTPDLPGSRIMSVMLPTNLIAVAILGLLMLSLIRRLNQILAERGALEAKASHLAYHDPLTGLPNRTLLNDRLQGALKGAQRRQIALLLIDLDRFKQVNDTLGHLAGDEMIREFAARLTSVTGPRNTVARLGGDEFAVIVQDRHWPKTTETVAGQILALFVQPLDLSGTRVFGGASIGAARIDDDDVDSTELMRRADVALYRAKAEGRNCARLYEASMDEGARKRTRLEAELRDAMSVGGLSVSTQPQVDRAGRLVGAEMLLRWNHPKFGLVSPEQVIPLAEETGLILPIGEWVLEQAIAVAKKDPSLFVAVNLSPIQLRDADFARKTIDSVRRAGVEPAQIELEITERVLLDESRTIYRSLVRLRRAGFRLALDDFGTGYSSLSYLRRFAVDKIKIDRSFVADIQRSEDARAIVVAIVALAKALRLIITAEGVETREQADILVAAGCDQLQGYYFGRPSGGHSINASSKASIEAA